MAVITLWMGIGSFFITSRIASRATPSSNKWTANRAPKKPSSVGAPHFALLALTNEGSSTGRVRRSNRARRPPKQNSLERLGTR